METAEVFCPAKVNLMLAVTGERPDGYRDLISLVAPLEFGDRLALRRVSKAGVSLKSSGNPVPSGEGNLAVRAATAFLERHPADGGLELELRKSIPLGAGLGGGSSDAAGVLLGLNKLLGFPAGTQELHDLALGIGSDCPLFLHRGPVILRGRGETIEPLTPAEAAGLRRRRLLLFKPFFGVPTAWAYREIARAGAYSSSDAIEARLGAWRRGEEPLESIMTNDFESVVGTKYPAVALVLAALRKEIGLSALLSGSGSAAFALLPEAAPTAEIDSLIRDAYGPHVFLEQTRIGGSHAEIRG